MISRLPDLVGARRDGSVSLADATIIAVLRAIQLGWRAAADVAEGDAAVLSQELPMTHRLCAAMGRVVDSSQDQYPMRITPGTVVIPSEDAPRPVGLTDISIYLNGLPGHDPHAIIECKRVHGGDRKLCRLYVVEGIDRFRCGKYGADHAQDFMVGFVVQGDVGGAVAGINRYLHGRQRHVDQLADSDILAEPWVRQSCHPRQDQTRTTLHHAFLLVPRESPKATTP